MAEIIPFEDIKKLAERCDVLTLFERRQRHDADACHTETEVGFPSSRPGISANLSDLFEQANAVAMRHYDGDPKVPAIVAEKCIELLTALTEHAEPE